VGGGGVEHLGQASDHVDGGADLVALVAADDLPGGPDGFGQVVLGPAFLFCGRERSEFLVIPLK
jgi:hypothetical protein